MLKKLTVAVALILCMSITFSPKTETDKTPTQNSELIYLALGDSYTIGESVSENERWPNQLRAALNSNGCSVGKPTIIAQTGWRTDNLLNAAKKDKKLEKYDFVSLLIGVNNEFQGRSPETFETDFLACLEFAISRCKTGNKRVFVFSIPDYGYTPFGKRNRTDISTRIDDFNAVCKRVSAEKKVAYFDITTISRKGLKNKNLVASDGLHPSGLQYKLWVDEYLEAIHQIVLP